MMYTACRTAAHVAEPFPIRLGDAIDRRASVVTTMVATRKALYAQRRMSISLNAVL
jgi:hypothetical protein